MTQRHEVSKYCRKSDADRLARHKVVTKLQFVKKKKKTHYLQSAIKGGMPV